MEIKLQLKCYKVEISRVNHNLCQLHYHIAKKESVLYDIREEIEVIEMLGGDCFKLVFGNRYLYLIFL